MPTWHSRLSELSVPSEILRVAHLSKWLKRKALTRFTVEDDFLKLTSIISKGNTGLRYHDHPIITYETMYKHHVPVSRTPFNFGNTSMLAVFLILGFCMVTQQTWV